MGRGLGDILHTLTLVLPWWAVAGALGVIVVLAIPGWRYSARTRQIRGAVRRLVRAEPDQRDALVRRAFDAAGDDPHLLALVASEARKRTLPGLVDDALRRLDAHPRGAALARGLRDEVAAQRIEPMHPLEAAVRVEALLEVGAVEAARARLAEALEQHPGDPELARLADAIARAARPATE